MVAKVALTLALAHEPRLLVLDEPTDGLDAVVRKEFLESIVSVAADEGRTVLISSHLLQDVERVADRVALMEESRIGARRGRGRAQGAVPRTEDHLRRLALRSLGEGGRRARPGGKRFEMPGVLSLRKEPREWLMVFEKFGPETIAQLQSKLPGAQIAARDMTLEEIFVALVGKSAGESTPDEGKRV